MITGWWYTYPSEKYDFVSWDDDIPNWMESHNMVPNHQPDKYIPLNLIESHRISHEILANH